MTRFHNNRIVLGSDAGLLGEAVRSVCGWRSRAGRFGVGEVTSSGDGCPRSEMILAADR